MKKYSKYISNDNDSISEIPSHWRIKKFGLISYMKGRIGWQNLRSSDFTDSGPFLITGMNFTAGVIRWEEVYHIPEERYNEAPEIQLKLNDVLMTKDGTIGKLLYIDYLPDKASLNSHLLVFRPLDRSYHPRFLYFNLQSQPFLHHIELCKSGTTFYGITQEAVSHYKVVLPPLDEQTAIAAYLDEKTSKIDTLIKSKQKLIELLKEERAAIINQAVTKGLNPNVKMKSSGIEWLGEIPAHWVVKKLKYLVSKVGSGVTPSGGANVYLQEGIPLLRSQNIYPDGLVLEDVAYISEAMDQQMSNSRVQDGDVLLNITGASIGRCSFIPQNFGSGNVNQHVCIIRPQTSLISTTFLHTILSSDYGQTLINLQQTGANREGLNFQELKTFDIPLPALREQEAITTFLKKKKTSIGNAISQIEKEIELLQEYRTALISEVVTGKVCII